MQKRSSARIDLENVHGSSGKRRLCIYFLLFLIIGMSYHFCGIFYTVYERISELGSNCRERNQKPSYGTPHVADESTNVMNGWMKSSGFGLLFVLTRLFKTLPVNCFFWKYSVALRPTAPHLILPRLES